MADPCKQEASIAKIEAREDMLARTLEEIKSGQNRFIEVLEGVAAQNEQIKSLILSTEKTSRDVGELFQRIRKSEMEIVGLKEFRKNHDQQESDAKQISGPIKSGLMVAAIIATAAFMFWLLDGHNYLNSNNATLPAVATGNAKKRRE